LEVENHKNPWKTLQTELKFETPWIKVVKHDVINPAGNPGLYGVVNFQNLAIGVLPLDKDYNTWLVGQWRYPLNEYHWEIPEGGGAFGIHPIESAKRELKEETGIEATEWHYLCHLALSNSATDEIAHIYAAKGLTFGESEPEESEDLTVKKVNFTTAFEMVMEGKITDAMSVVAILKAKILIDKGVL
jgi:ADP-ribose pyrophosphatase